MPWLPPWSVAVGGGEGLRPRPRLRQRKVGTIATRAICDEAKQDAERCARASYRAGKGFFWSQKESYFFLSQKKGRTAPEPESAPNQSSCARSSLPRASPQVQGEGGAPSPVLVDKALHGGAPDASSKVVGERVQMAGREDGNAPVGPEVAPLPVPVPGQHFHEHPRHHARAGVPDDVLGGGAIGRRRTERRSRRRRHHHHHLPERIGGVRPQKRRQQGEGGVRGRGGAEAGSVAGLPRPRHHSPISSIILPTMRCPLAAPMRPLFTSTQPTLLAPQ